MKLTVTFDSYSRASGATLIEVEILMSYAEVHAAAANTQFARAFLSEAEVAGEGAEFRIAPARLARLKKAIATAKPRQWPSS